MKAKESNISPLIQYFPTGFPYSSLNDLYDISYDYGEAENMIGEQKQKVSKFQQYLAHSSLSVDGLDPVSVRRTPQLVTQPLELVGGHEAAWISRFINITSDSHLFMGSEFTGVTC